MEFIRKEKAMRKFRLGKFEIPREIILDDPETAIAITNGMLIYRAEMMLHMDCIEYMAISPMFDEIDNGSIPPSYEIIIEKTDEEIKVKVRRKSP